MDMYLYTDYNLFESSEFEKFKQILQNHLFIEQKNRNLSSIFFILNNQGNEKLYSTIEFFPQKIQINFPITSQLENEFKNSIYKLEFFQNVLELIITQLNIKNWNCSFRKEEIEKLYKLKNFKYLEYKDPSQTKLF